MWLVGKDTTGKTGRVAISDELKAALVRWYTGRGSEADHRASVSLVSTARENHKWIACDCLGAERPPPLMSAAYLSFQETYYLRRLTSRPGHDTKCPFHLPQAPPRIRETAKDSLYAIGLPKGLFSAHQTRRRDPAAWQATLAAARKGRRKRPPRIAAQWPTRRLDQRRNAAPQARSRGPRDRPGHSAVGSPLHQRHRLREAACPCPVTLCRPDLAA